MYNSIRIIFFFLLHFYLNMCSQENTYNSFCSSIVFTRNNCLAYENPNVVVVYTGFNIIYFKIVYNTHHEDDNV